MAKLCEARGWVLHIKPFQDHKRLVDVLLSGVGRMKVVLYPNKREPLMLMTPYHFTISGHRELKNAHAYEAVGHPVALQGKGLFCALYVNELLVRLLPLEDDVPDLFEEYERLLGQLNCHHRREIGLRQFEFWLLDMLGVACDWFSDAHSGLPVDKDRSYGFRADEGVFELDPLYQAQGIPGSILIDIFEGRFEDPKSMGYAKWLVREAYAPLLGDRPLNSRQLFLKSVCEPSGFQ